MRTAVMAPALRGLSGWWLVGRIGRELTAVKPPSPLPLPQAAGRPGSPAAPLQDDMLEKGDVLSPFPWIPPLEGGWGLL